MARMVAAPRIRRKINGLPLELAPCPDDLSKAPYLPFPSLARACVAVDPRMSPVLSDAVFWVAVVACAVAQLAILRSVLGTKGLVRPTPATGAPLRAQPRAVEIAWAVLPALALAAVLALTWRALHPAAPDSATSATPAAITAAEV
jgi:hypothetical protein